MNISETTQNFKISPALADSDNFDGRVVRLFFRYGYPPFGSLVRFTHLFNLLGPLPNGGERRVGCVLRFSCFFLRSFLACSHEFYTRGFYEGVLISWLIWLSRDSPWMSGFERTYRIDPYYFIVQFFVFTLMNFDTSRLVHKHRASAADLLEQGGLQGWCARFEFSFFPQITFLIMVLTCLWEYIVSASIVYFHFFDDWQWGDEWQCIQAISNWTHKKLLFFVHDFSNSWVIWGTPWLFHCFLKNSDKQSDVAISDAPKIAGEGHEMFVFSKFHSMYLLQGYLQTASRYGSSFFKKKIVNESWKYL